MRILTPGALPSPDPVSRRFRGRCTHCRCFVECEQLELLAFTGDLTRQNTGIIVCPTVGCGRSITVNRYVTREDAKAPRIQS